MSKSFLFVKCSLLMVLLFVIAVAVMGHRKFDFICAISFNQIKISF